MAVPVSVQVPLFMKILTSDRNLKTRAGKEIVVGIIYREKFRQSLNVKDEFLKFVEQNNIKKFNDIPIRFVPIDIGDGSNLKDTISRYSQSPATEGNGNNVDILYVTPVRVLEIKTITDISRTQKILTLTGVPEYVESGLSVSIGIRAEKPLIIINLLGAKSEGAGFSSQLLKLAKVLY
jgi:hypothetical protein